MSYTPPTLPVALNFTGGAYTPPGVPMSIQFGEGPRSLAPLGFKGVIGAAAVPTAQASGLLQQAYGTPIIGYALITVTPASVSQWLSGVHVVNESLRINFTGAYTPPEPPVTLPFNAAVIGVDDASAGLRTLFGAATIEDTAFVARPEGVDSLAMGEPRVAAGRRVLEPQSVDSLAIGASAVTFWVQQSRVFGGINGFASGAAQVRRSPEYVEVPWVAAFSAGSHTIGTDRTVGPTPFLATTIGAPRVLDNSQEIRQAGGIAGVVGDVSTRMDPMDIRPTGFLSAPEFRRWGVPELRPMLRYVQQLDATIREHQGFGLQALVYNVDRTLHPDALVSSEVSYRLGVVRAGQVIAPESLTPPSITLLQVAYAVRTSRAEPLLATFISNWSHVRNDARVLRPEANVLTQWGATSVRNDLRPLQQFFPAGPESFGMAWAAPAVRSVQVLQGIDEWRSIGPLVTNAVRTLVASGVLPKQVGAHDVSERRNVVTPQRELPYTRYGTEARVFNWNPEVRGAGVGYTGEFLRPLVRREFETVRAGDHLSTLIPVPSIGDSTRTVFHTNATAPPQITLLHQVRTDDPAGPFPQRIQCTGFQPWAVGNVTLNVRSIRPDGTVMTKWGAHAITANSILAQGIPPPGYGTGGNIGVPSVPGLQTIVADQHPRGPDLPWTTWGEPHMWPHTIWAPMGYPYGFDRGEQIDAWLHPNNPERPVFGRVVVRASPEQIYPETNVFRSGTADVSLAVRYVVPARVRAWQPGIPQIPAGIPLEPAGDDQASIGMHSVTRPAEPPGPRTLEPRTLAPYTEYGEHEVQLFNRELRPSSLIATTFGTQWVTRPYPPFEMVGFDAAQYGTPVIEYFHRTVITVGDDLLDMTPTPGWIGDRMRVRQHYTARPSGVNAGGFGTTFISLGDRRYFMPGIERPQAPNPAPRLASVVNASGHDSAIVLDARAWRSGDPLQPWPVECLAVGAARLSLQIGVAGLSGVIGSANVSEPVDPDGIDALRTGAAVVTHAGGHVCGRVARGVPAGAFMAGGIGATGVTHA